MSRQLCKLHPRVDYKTAWGCPDCVRELRAEKRDTLKELREIVSTGFKALAGDNNDAEHDALFLAVTTAQELIAMLEEKT